MAPLKPLEVLKKGLSSLKKHVDARRKGLQGRLAKKEKISDEDERWLDNRLVGGDDDADDDAVPDLRPSRCEALNAACIVQKFIAEIDEPYARKLKSVLASFGCQHTWKTAVPW